jgi:gluconate 2-dehydrogenase gamma chain
MPPLSRRHFIAALGATSVGAWLAADARELVAAGEHAARAAREPSPLPFQALTPEQAADIEAFAAQIVPTDDTPGAREAGVMHFIDRALSTFVADERTAFEQGHAALRARVKKAHPRAASFAALSDARQVALMRAMEKEHDPFFEAMRAATIAGMFASPEHGGNRDKVGWKLIGFEDRFSWAPPFGWYDRQEA